MGISPSVLKRERQDRKRHQRNKAVLTGLKTFIKRVNAAVVHRDIEAAKRLLPLTVSLLDKAAQKGVIHRNTASRKVSRLAHKVQQLVGEGAPKMSDTPKASQTSQQV